MKKVLIILIVILMVVFFYACDDSISTANPEEQEGAGTESNSDESTTDESTTDSGAEDPLPPAINSFSITSGPITTDGNFSVDITDDGTAVAWLITTDTTAPDSNDLGWWDVAPAAPVGFADYGTYNLYAWAKSSENIVSECFGPVSIEYIFITPGPEAGEIVITEIMNNPTVLDDTNGEWFEIYNMTSSDLNLEGCTFQDEGSNSFTINSELLISAHSYMTFAISDQVEFTSDYIYGTAFILSNSDDEIILMNDSTLIDSVAYEEAIFPDPNGASMQLHPDHMNAIDNDNGAYWSESTVVYGSGDYGTPGAANTSF